MPTVAMLVALLAAMLAAVAVAVRRPQRTTRWLRRATLAITVLAAALLTPYTVADSGAAAWYLLGVPVIAAAVPVVVDQIGSGHWVADLLGAVVMTGWGIIIALGLGLAFLPPALLMFAVVTIDITGRQPITS